jgi:hypothetical protein
VVELPAPINLHYPVVLEVEEEEVILPRSMPVMVFQVRVIVVVVLMLVAVVAVVAVHQQ